jgi:hypothetical protein
VIRGGLRSEERVHPGKVGERDVVIDHDDYGIELGCRGADGKGFTTHSFQPGYQG